MICLVGSGNLEQLSQSHPFMVLRTSASTGWAILGYGASQLLRTHFELAFFAAKWSLDDFILAVKKIVLVQPRRPNQSS